MTADEKSFSYPFSGTAYASVIAPDTAAAQSGDWICDRIEGWFVSHDKPKTGETVRIPGS
jgi:hypothetical protein